MCSSIVTDCLQSFAGVGTYDCIDSPTEILGELKDMKVTDMACRCDTVLALTG